MLAENHSQEVPRVLICCPNLKVPGGVSNYYRVIRRILLNPSIHFVEIGGAGKNFFGLYASFFIEPFYFIRRLVVINPAIVHLNPSLLPRSLLRSAVFLVIAKLFRCKIIVFWRGWSLDYERKVEQKYKKIFTTIFNKADVTLVLSKEFREKLIRMGIRHPVIVTTTLYDKERLTIAKGKVKDTRHADSTVLLFMSRLVNDKGIEEALEAFKLVKKYNRGLMFYIAGEGPLRKTLEERYKKDKDIEFLGNVDDERKYELLLLSDIFLFPSTYGEGMPNAVLEAMAAGRPVITTKVGGLADFFENNQNGLIVAKRDVQQLAAAVEYLAKNKLVRQNIGARNAKFAEKYFSGEVVSKKLMSVYKNVDEEKLELLPTYWS